VHRLAIELVNRDESDAVVADRAARRGWLESRDYRVVDVTVADVEADLEHELGRLQAIIAEAK
jgi:tRNA/rRNA methyltransferase